MSFSIKPFKFDTYNIKNIKCVEFLGQLEVEKSILRK